MTLRTWLFNVAPSGTDLNVSNLKATDGTAATQVAKDTGNTVKSSTTHATAGEYSMEVALANGIAAGLARLPFAASNTKGQYRFGFWTGAISPAGTQTIAGLRHASGYCHKLALETTTHKLTLIDSTGATIATASTGLSTSAWYDYSVVFDNAASTVTVKVYDASGTLVSGGGVTASTGNYTTNAAVLVEAGRNASGGAVSQYYRYFQMNDGGTTELSAYSAPSNTAPVASAGSAQYIDPGVVSLSGSVNDLDGSVASAAWSRVSGPNSPTITTNTSGIGTTTATATAAVSVIPGTYVFRLTGTDNLGASDTADVTIYVAADANADVKPLTELSGLYTKVGTATDRLTTITDGDPSTYLESPAAPDGDTEVWQWNPFGPGDITFYVSEYQSPSSPAVTVTFDVYKEDGTTLIYTDSWASSAGNAEHVVTVDSTGLAAVTGDTDAETRELRRALITKLSATSA